jgi:VPDSG-CTERM motif
MKSATRKAAILALTTVALTSAFSLFADSIIVDRGLPTANLNNSAGANRANIAWAAGLYTPNAYAVVGDSFQNTSANMWSIDTIRLWSTSPLNAVALWAGIAGSGVYGSTAGTISAATYAVNDGNGHNTFQGASSGSYYNLWQLDFAVNATLAPGQTYDFFLDGTGNTDLGSDGKPLVIPYVHASNAALSGSTQQGADGLMLSATVQNGILGSINSWSSQGASWDKASDVNVQVFGAVPDGGTTATLLGGVLSALAVLRRKLA